MPRPSRWATNPPPSAPSPEDHDPARTTSRVQEYIEALPTFRPGSHNTPPSAPPSSITPTPQPVLSSPLSTVISNPRSFPPLRRVANRPIRPSPQQVRRTFYHYPDPPNPSRTPPAQPTSSPFTTRPPLTRDGPLYSAERPSRPPPRRQHTEPQPAPAPAPRPTSRRSLLSPAQRERITRVELDMYEGRGMSVPIVRYHLGPRRGQQEERGGGGGEGEGSEGVEEEEEEEEGATARWVNEQRHYGGTSGDYRRR